MTSRQTFLQHWWDSLRYGLHLIIHPFDGFWDLKHAGKGSVGAATTLLLLTVFSYTFNRQYAGYFFTSYNPNTFSILLESLTVLLPFGLWVAANWCLTTLMDGEGTLKDIYIATAYSLTPIVILYVPATILSMVLSEGSGAYYQFFLILALLWSLLLLILGTSVTHQYTITKTLLTCIGNILGMLFLLFLGLILYHLVQQVLAFVVNSYTELSFRL